MGITYRTVCNLIEEKMKFKEFITAQNRYLALGMNISESVYKIDLKELEKYGIYSIEFSNKEYNTSPYINGLPNYSFTLNVDISFFKLNKSFEKCDNINQYKIMIQTMNTKLKKLNLLSYNNALIVLDKDLILDSLTIVVNDLPIIGSTNKNLCCLFDKEPFTDFNISLPNSPISHFYNVYQNCTFNCGASFLYILYYCLNYKISLDLLMKNNNKIKPKNICIEFSSNNLTFLLEPNAFLFNNYKYTNNRFEVFLNDNHPIDIFLRVYSKYLAKYKKIYKKFDINFIITTPNILSNYDETMSNITQLIRENRFKSITVLTEDGEILLRG